MDGTVEFRMSLFRISQSSCNERAGLGLDNIKSAAIVMILGERQRGGVREGESETVEGCSSFLTFPEIAR